MININNEMMNDLPRSETKSSSGAESNLRSRTSESLKHFCQTSFYGLKSEDVSNVENFFDFKTTDISHRSFTRSCETKQRACRILMNAREESHQSLFILLPSC